MRTKCALDESSVFHWVFWCAWRQYALFHWKTSAEFLHLSAEIWHVLQEVLSVLMQYNSAGSWECFQYLVCVWTARFAIFVIVVVMKMNVYWIKLHVKFVKLKTLLTWCMSIDKEVKFISLVLNTRLKLLALVISGIAKDLSDLGDTKAFRARA